MTPLRAVSWSYGFIVSDTYHRTYYQGKATVNGAKLTGPRRESAKMARLALHHLITKLWWPRPEFTGENSHTGRARS